MASKTGSTVVGELAMTRRMAPVARSRSSASPVGNLVLFDGEAFRLVAQRGMPSDLIGAWQRPQRYGPHTGPTRAVTERRPVQIMDMMADRAYEERDPIRVWAVEILGGRTALFVPMLKEGTPVGVIATWRREVQAFSENQIQLLSTFADQAVIAIENVRLFTELGTRNRELTEALEQQTATGEILRVISSSPTDVRPVFDAIVRSARGLFDGLSCTAWRLDGEQLHRVASNNFSPGVDEAIAAMGPVSLTRGNVGARAILDRAVVHVPDIEADPEATGARE